MRFEREDLRETLCFTGEMELPLRRKTLARLRNSFGRRRFIVKSNSDCARSGTEGSRWFSLFFDDAVLLCFACVETLCALELLRWRHVFTSWTREIWRKPRAKASFSHLQLLEFEGGIALKLCFHICNFWNLCKLCSTKQYWHVLCASFVVQRQSSTGTCFVQVF